MAWLRARAISHTFFPPTTLKAAIERLGFVQADPIRAPARAQDLILRHRVKKYHAGDLERRYDGLDIEEDYLYAYGFLPRDVQSLLHPRSETSLGKFERTVLEAIRGKGPIHPRKLDADFGRRRVVNAWGGYSKATKRALERLHHRGFLRVTRREQGIRVYELAPATSLDLSPEERLRKLVVVVANVLAPVADKTLRAVAAQLRRHVARRSDHQVVIKSLIGHGELKSKKVDGVTYLWPALSERSESKGESKRPPSVVRFLAPFDPLVSDRRRFEHLWQWSYRFEAYTPPAKRIRGYYALPMLWQDAVVGWVNARVVDSTLSIEPGFVAARPAERDFEREFEAEVDRFREFLL